MEDQSAKEEKTVVPRKQRSVARKALKISLISLSSLIGFVILVVAVVLGIVLSPKRITPIINKYADKFMQAEVRVEKVDLSLFSVYPYVGLNLSNGLVVSHALRDSAFTASDTLLSFSSCRVSLNVKKYMKEKSLEAGKVKLYDARCYLFTSADSLSNFNIFGTSSKEKDDTDTSSAALPDITVKRLEIVNADVCYEDRTNRLYIHAQDVNLSGEGALDSACAEVLLDFNTGNARFERDGQKLVAGLPLGLHLQGGFDLNTYSGKISEAAVRIKQLGLGLEGAFSIDTASGNIDMDLNADLKTASLQEVMDMIPQTFLQTQGVTADGEVKLSAHVYGTYGRGRMPLMRVDLDLENGKAQYEGMPYPIDTINTKLEAYIDLNKKTSSYINLEELSVVAKDAEILTECRIDRMLTRPYIDIKFSSDLDLSVISKIVPLRRGLDMSGFVEADLDGKFLLADLQKANIGNIAARGKFALYEVNVDDSASKMHVDADALLRFREGKYLGGVFRFNSLHCNMPKIKAFVDTMEIKAVSQKPAENAPADAIVSMAGSVNYTRLSVVFDDTVKIFSAASKAKAKLIPDENNPKKPCIKFDCQTDSLFAAQGDLKARLTTAKIQVELTKTKKDDWWPLVDVNLQRAAITAPRLSEPVELRRFEGIMDGDNLDIEKARFRLGNSRFDISGKVWDALSIPKNNGRIRANLTLKSNLLDCNQLLNIMAKPVDEEQLEKEASQQLATDTKETDAATYVADTLQQVRLFMVPDNLDLQLTIDAKKVYYDRMSFDTIKGKVFVRNKAVNLRELTMKSWGADIDMNLVYATRSRERADVGAFLDVHSVRIEQLIKSFPDLDSTLPMLKSFEGIVDLQTTASAQLDSSMNILLPGLTAALRLRGDSLVLLDGETFTEISKLLMFKNKQRNLIDSISAVITVQDGNITVYPFMIEMDRYKVGVGGKQNMNMDYDYHISVLSSPIGSLGVTLKGNMNTGKRPKIKLGKALYKNEITPAKERQVDRARLDLGRQIMLQFEGWMNRERRRVGKVNFPKVESAPESELRDPDEVPAPVPEAPVPVPEQPAVLPQEPTLEQ